MPRAARHLLYDHARQKTTISFRHFEAYPSYKRLSLPKPRPKRSKTNLHTVLFTNTAQRTQALHYFSTFRIDSHFDSQPSPPAGSHFMHSNKAASSLKNTDSEQYCFAIHNTSQSTPKRHLIRCDAPHAFTLETRARAHTAHLTLTSIDN